MADEDISSSGLRQRRLPTSSISMKDGERKEVPVEAVRVEAPHREVTKKLFFLAVLVWVGSFCTVMYTRNDLPRPLGKSAPLNVFSEERARDIVAGLTEEEVAIKHTGSYANEVEIPQLILKEVERIVAPLKLGDFEYKLLVSREGFAKEEESPFSSEAKVVLGEKPESCVCPIDRSDFASVLKDVGELERDGESFLKASLQSTEGGVVCENISHLKMCQGGERKGEIYLLNVRRNILTHRASSSAIKGKLVDRIFFLDVSYHSNFSGTIFDMTNKLASMYSGIGHVGVRLLPLGVLHNISRTHANINDKISEVNQTISDINQKNTEIDKKNTEKNQTKSERNTLNRLQNAKNELRKLNLTTLLLSSHYDGYPLSPAAADATSCVAIILEVLSNTLNSPPENHFPLMLSLNGSEETSLQGSHAFITGHPWAQQVGAVINLEASGQGGKESLFQVTRSGSRLIDLYKEAAPYPRGNVIAQELFERKIIPGDTDFTMYRDVLDVPAMDFAWSSLGYYYHTSEDKLSRIPPGSIQHYGSNIRAVSEAVGLDLRRLTLEQLAEIEGGFEESGENLEKNGKNSKENGENSGGTGNNSGKTAENYENKGKNSEKNEDNSKKNEENSKQHVENLKTNGQNSEQNVENSTIQIEQMEISQMKSKGVYEKYNSLIFFDVLGITLAKIAKIDTTQWLGILCVIWTMLYKAEKEMHKPKSHYSLLSLLTPIIHFSIATLTLFVLAYLVCLTNLEMRWYGSVGLSVCMYGCPSVLVWLCGFLTSSQVEIILSPSVRHRSLAERESTAFHMNILLSCLACSAASLSRSSSYYLPLLWMLLSVGGRVVGLAILYLFDSGSFECVPPSGRIFRVSEKGGIFLGGVNLLSCVPGLVLCGDILVSLLDALIPIFGRSGVRSEIVLSCVFSVSFAYLLNCYTFVLFYLRRRAVRILALTVFFLGIFFFNVALWGFAPFDRDHPKRLEFTQFISTHHNKGGPTTVSGMWVRCSDPLCLKSPGITHSLDLVSGSSPLQSDILQVLESSFKQIGENNTLKWIHEPVANFIKYPFLRPVNLVHNDFSYIPLPPIFELPLPNPLAKYVKDKPIEPKNLFNKINPPQIPIPFDTQIGLIPNTLYHTRTNLDTHHDKIELVIKGGQRISLFFYPQNVKGWSFGEAYAELNPICNCHWVWYAGGRNSREISFWVKVTKDSTFEFSTNSVYYGIMTPQMEVLKTLGETSNHFFTSNFSISEHNVWTV